jgi:hypothetical protein
VFEGTELFNKGLFHSALVGPRPLVLQRGGCPNERLLRNLPLNPVAERHQKYRAAPSNGLGVASSTP